MQGITFVADTPSHLLSRGRYHAQTTMHGPTELTWQELNSCVFYYVKRRPAKAANHPELPATITMLLHWQAAAMCKN